MAIVTAPLLSFAGSGTFADVLTASSLRGSAVIRRRPRARQTWTAEQRSHYTRLSFLQSAWRTLDNHTPAGLKATWQPVADELNLPLYQAYVKSNYARWTTTLSPIISPGGGGVGGSTIIPAAANSGKGFIGFSLTRSLSNNAFGLIMFLALGAIPTGLMNEIALVQPNWYPGPSSLRFLITHLAPGVYRIRSKAMYTNGTLSTFNFLSGSLTVT